MTKTKVGFIGTRDLNGITQERFNSLDELINKYVNPKLFTISTGAAKGIDQWIGNRILEMGGHLQLYLPWSSYEQNWVAQIKSLPNVYVGIYNPQLHTEATASVRRYHPNFNALKSSVIALHARNYLIIQGCSLVIALPKISNGKPLGGTAQGIRIAEGLNIPTIII